MSQEVVGCSAFVVQHFINFYNPRIMFPCWQWCNILMKISLPAAGSITIPSHFSHLKDLCKLAYMSFHNQHKYCPVVNSTTIDYSAFWRNCICGGQSLHAYSLDSAGPSDGDLPLGHKPATESHLYDKNPPVTPLMSPLSKRSFSLPDNGPKSTLRFPTHAANGVSVATANDRCFWKFEIV